MSPDVPTGGMSSPVIKVSPLDSGVISEKADGGKNSELVAKRVGNWDEKWTKVAICILIPIFATISFHLTMVRHHLPWAGEISLILGVLFAAIGWISIRSSREHRFYFSSDSVVTLIGISFGVVGIVASVLLGELGLFVWSIVAASLYIIGLGLVISPSDTLVDRITLAPAWGVGVTLLTFALLGEVARITLGWSWIAVGLLGVASSLRLRKRDLRIPRIIRSDLSFLVCCVTAILAILLLGFYIVYVPQVVFNPAMPFGPDLQHAGSVHSILTTGFPAQQSLSTSKFYPQAFSYWVAVLALVAHAPTTKIFQIFPIILWLFGLLQLLMIGRALFGVRAGFFAGIAYCLWSFQPKQTFFDGTDVGVLAEYFMLPAALFAGLRLIQQPSLKRILIFGVLLGMVAQTHFLATSRMILIFGAFIAVLLIVSSNRVEIAKAVSLSAVVGFIVGLPFTFNYANIYITFVVSIFRGSAANPYSASYPGIPFPSGYEGVMGTSFLVLSAFSIVLFAFMRKRLDRQQRYVWWWIVSWVAAVELSVVTHLLLVPERDLRSLAIPLALVIGSAIDVFFTALNCGVASSAAVAALVVVISNFTFPDLVQHTLDVAKTEIYSNAQQLKFLSSLNIDRKYRTGFIATDFSGIALKYFDPYQPIIVPGGKSEWQWYGRPDRQKFSIVFHAMQDPCSLNVSTKLRSIGVKYLYFGPEQTAWTPPGYVYMPGNAPSTCPGFKLLASSPATENWFYEVR